MSAPEVKFMNGQYVALIDGKIVRRTKKEHMDYVIRKAMEAEAKIAPVNFGEESSDEGEVETNARFTVHQRFGFVADMITMLAKGIQPSVIITGPGGLGKTHTVMSALTDAGFEDGTLLTGLDEDDVVNREKLYTVVKGYSTPKGLYRTLYENRDGVIVFDDCDRVLQDSDAINLLKGALDSYDRRIISWRADMKDDDLPNAFEFEGRVVFISNRPSHKIDQAILSRSMVVDLSMSTDEKIERMQFLVDQPEFMEEYPKNIKQEALNHIATLKDKAKDLSLRTLITVSKIRMAGGANWKDLAEYAIS